jgi:hypothetical protein
MYPYHGVSSHSLYGNHIGEVGREALATAANLTGVYM